MCAAMVERDPGLNSFNDDRYYSQGGQQNMSFNQDYQPPSGGFANVPPAYHGDSPQKKDQESRRLDEVYGRRSHAPEKPELFDYKKQQQQNYEEKKKEYQEFLGPGSMPSPLKPDHKKESEETKQRLFAEQKKREYNDFLVKEQIQRDHKLEIRNQQRTPPGRFPFDKYQTYQQKMKEKRKEEFQEYLDEQNKQPGINPHFKKEAEKRRWDLEGAPTNQGGGFNFGGYEDYRKELKEKRKQEFLEYQREKEQQQKEQMLSKAQHQIEVPRFNGSPQRTSSQPPVESSRPPPQEYDRMPPPEFSRRSRDGPMSSMEQQISNDHAYEDRKQQLMREIGVDKEARDRQYRDMFDRDRDARDIHAQEFHRHDEQLRDKNIMEYLEKKRIEEERQFNHPRKKKLGPDSVGQIDESYDPSRYEEMRHRLQDETHQEYKKELAKPRLSYSAQQDTRIPIAKGFDFNVQKIIPTGDKVFEGIHKAIREDYLQDFRDYSQKHYQNVKEKPKEFWKTDRLQIVPTSGEYSKRSQRFKEQLHRDFQEIQNQKEPPKARNKDFGEKGQVLIKDPSKDYTSRHKQAEQEFKQSFQEYMAEKKKNPEHPKRNLNKRPDSGKDPAKNPSKQIGYMAFPGAREHDRKREERPYNGYAPEQPSWYNQEVAPVGLATPNKDEYRQPRERQGSYNHKDYVRDSPTYQEMLESKRRHEAAYRRYDDPGLNHYPQTGQSDPVDNHSPRRYSINDYGDRNRYLY